MARKARRRSSANAHRPRHGLVLGVYVAAVFLSALLLFAVQPMFTRMVLPRLGGSPSVWSVAMVFFQSMLLAGYAYAHVLTTSRHRYVPAIIHLGVMGIAASTLPLAIAQGWGNPPVTAGAPFWLLGLFAVSIGLPFFALSANNPLLQTWFSQTTHRDAHDPYFLYAASNIGSILALISYPVFFEPVFTLQLQNRLWSIGFLLLVALIGACAMLMLRTPAPRVRRQTGTETAPRPTWPMIGRWIFISAIPAGLLVAVTAYISTDIASAPLVWVVPLSLYLLTWVLVFQRRSPITHRKILLVQPFAIAGIVLLLFYAIWIPVLDGLAAHLAAFFVIAMACHGELARTRPDPRHLTTFYVALSFGGMTGGLFSGLIAPYAFSWVAEYPILAVLAVLCRPFDQEIWKPLERWFWWMAPSYWPRLTVNFWPVAIAAVLILIFSGFADQSFGEDPDLVKFSVWALVGASVALWRDPPKSAFMVALALVLTWGYPSNETNRETVRSFFGVHKVYDTDDGRFRVFKHGSTIHGAQRLETEDGGLPTGRPIPITYYHDNSAMNRAIKAVRARKGAPLHVAVIGLGIGTLACRIADGETWRFFEIDPAVIEIARDPKRFSFLSSCAPNLPIVLGDARLTFAAEPDQSYDLIIMDAYSSDAIPVHLATAEAMAIYKSKLAPHGVVMMHISNRYLELRSVVGGIAAANNLKTWIWDRQIEESKDIDYIFSSDVAIAAESAVDIGALADDGRWVLTPPNPAVRTWTDDYSNIAGAIWRKHAK